MQSNDDTTTTTTIERSIEIDATPDRVWGLVSEPGWWINDGTYTEHVIEERDGITYVTDPTHGVFPLTVVSSQQPHHIAYRWLARTDEPRPDGPGTLTEFWIEESEGGVTLRVRESGFESLGESETDVLKTIADNSSGWETMLALARERCRS